MTKCLSEEQQTFNALTDNELDECLHDLMEHGFHESVLDVFSQAKEANRLREGLEALHTELKLFGDLSGDYTCEHILGLLEGE